MLGEVRRPQSHLALAPNLQTTKHTRAKQKEGTPHALFSLTLCAWGSWLLLLLGVQAARTFGVVIVVLLLLCEDCLFRIMICFFLLFCC